MIDFISTTDHLIGPQILTNTFCIYKLNLILSLYIINDFGMCSIDRFPFGVLFHFHVLVDWLFFLHW